MSFSTNELDMKKSFQQTKIQKIEDIQFTTLGILLFKNEKAVA